MARASRSNQKSKLFIITLGCLSVFLLLVGVTGAAAIWAGLSYRSLGAPTADEANLAFAMPAVVTRDSGRPGSGSVPPEGAALAPLSSLEFADPRPQAPLTRLEIDLAEGQFEVIPGPPGSDITVTGTIATAYYELEENRQDETDGRSVSLRLRSTAGFLTRIIAGLTHFDSNHPNNLTVSIPPDMPIDLSLRMDSGQSKVELGGLHLTNLKAAFSKGEHRMTFAEPNSGEMENMDLAFTMGDGSARGLGNAHARNLSVDTGMGSFSIALDGDWMPGDINRATISHDMGDLTLRVPKDVRIDEDSSSMILMGGMSGRLKENDQQLPADAPVLHLDVDASMGGVNIRRTR